MAYETWNYWNNFWSKAEEIDTVLDPVKGLEDAIKAAEKIIKDQNCIYLDRMTYWEDISNDSYSSDTSVVGSDDSIFETIEEATWTTGQDVLGLRLRALQIGVNYARDDKTVTFNGDTSAGPTRITTCEDSDGHLAGMQVSYGRFNPQAGLAHGNIMDAKKCTETILYNKITQINIWTWAVDLYAGMEIVMMDYTDGKAEGTSLQVGKQTGARKATIDFPYNDREFFGFQT